eukprot:scaffold4372_cov397-Prasinococcus_capsulatus_cf.AAC.15
MVLAHVTDRHFASTSSVVLAATKLSSAHRVQSAVWKAHVYPFSEENPTPSKNDGYWSYGSISLDSKCSKLLHVTQAMEGGKLAVNTFSHRTFGRGKWFASEGVKWQTSKSKKIPSIGHQRRKKALEAGLTIDLDGAAGKAPSVVWGTHVARNVSYHILVSSRKDSRSKSQRLIVYRTWRARNDWCGVQYKLRFAFGGT